MSKYLIKISGVSPRDGAGEYDGGNTLAAAKREGREFARRVSRADIEIYTVTRGGRLKWTADVQSWPLGGRPEFHGENVTAGGRGTAPSRDPEDVSEHRAHRTKYKVRVRQHGASSPARTWGPFESKAKAIDYIAQKREEARRNGWGALVFELVNPRESERDRGRPRSARGRRDLERAAETIEGHHVSVRPDDDGQLAMIIYPEPPNWPFAKARQISASDGRFALFLDEPSGRSGLRRVGEFRVDRGATNVDVARGALRALRSLRARGFEEGARAAAQQELAERRAKDQKKSDRRARVSRWFDKLLGIGRDRPRGAPRSMPRIRVERGPGGNAMWHVPALRPELGKERSGPFLLYWNGPGARLMLGFTPSGRFTNIDHHTADGNYRDFREADRAARAFVEEMKR